MVLGIKIFQNPKGAIPSTKYLIPVTEGWRIKSITFSSFSANLTKITRRCFRAKTTIT